MWGWAEKLFTGYSSEELQTESDALDDKLAKVNQDALDRGAITPEIYAQTSANISAGRIDAEGEISDAFAEGWQEGIANERKFIGDAVTFPLKFIDWRIWVLGALVLLVYMGGWARLRNILKK